MTGADIALALVALICGAAGYVCGHIHGMERGYRLGSNTPPSQETGEQS